jgi:DNA invertase Pin-like site-specific DNA recombinase
VKGVEMIEKRGLKAVGYIRVSTEEQAKEGVSLDAQGARIKAYCAAKGWTLLRVYRDEGVSGKDLNRPGIKSLLNDLKGNGVDVVVTVKLDRLTRSIRDLGVLIEDLFSGVSLASVEESLDSSTAGGRMVINLLGTVAQWERETVSERTKAALDYKADQGEWCGRIPYGFKVVGKKLVEDPVQMQAIESMKRMHRRGQSVRTIAAKFNLGKSTVHKIVTTDLRELKSFRQPAAVAV